MNNEISMLYATLKEINANRSNKTRLKLVLLIKLKQIFNFDQLTEPNRSNVAPNVVKSVTLEVGEDNSCRLVMKSTTAHRDR